MSPHSFQSILGMFGGVALPLWNIPLIVTIRRRRSSRDISLAWAIGVWVCLVVMVPSGLSSTDAVYRVFTLANALLFTVVLVEVLRFRRT